MSGNKFFEGLVVGGVFGYIFAVLSTPKSGAQLRKELQESGEDLYRHATDSFSDLKGKTEQAVHDIQNKGDAMLRKAQASMQETKEQLAHRLDELAKQGTKVLTEEPESRI